MFILCRNTTLPTPFAPHPAFAGTKLKSAADRQLKSEPVVDPKAKGKVGAGGTVPAPLSMINIAQMAAERSKQLKKVSAAAGGGGSAPMRPADVKPEEWR